MALFKANKVQEDKVNEDGYQIYSTPFYKVGEGNLSLPYVSNRIETMGIVRFGTDNLYPQLLNQMYYTSPLHGSIINFKARSAIGGGYEIVRDGLTAIENVNLYKFEKTNKLHRMIDVLCKDMLLHNRAYFLIHHDEKQRPVNVERVAPEKVRVNRNKTQYAISEDWSTNLNLRYVKPYGRNCTDKVQLYCYEEYSVGQDHYPLPQYSSALNWCFLDGEMSYLHKSNILNSIFPSFALMFPNKPHSEEEKNKLREQIEGMKGAGNAGKVATFFANGKDNMPEISTIPINQNDNLFLQTDERIDGKICQAHQVDPLIFGIRVSGKLGSGTELERAHLIFEKDTIIPLRMTIEEIINDLMRYIRIER
jgi:hypothetical protein